MDESQTFAFQNDKALRERYAAFQLAAAVLTMTAMAALYWTLSGPDLPDWLGYSQIYDRDGGWLARQGRDPIFTALIRGAHAMFGGEGYADFRLSLFAVFAIASGSLAYRMSASQATPLGIVLIVVSVFFLKSLVQIRECLAFVIMLWPMAGVLDRKHAALVSLVAVTAAIFTHSGLMVFGLAWVIAFLATSTAPRLIEWKGLAFWLAVLGVAAGCLATVLLSQDAGELEYSFQDFGAQRAANAVGGSWKYAYWLFNGVLALMIRRMVWDASDTMGPFLSWFFKVLGGLALPAVYAVCLILVLTDFHLPALTALMARMFLTIVEACLLVIGLRGRAGLYSVAVAAAVLAEQVWALTQSIAGV